MKESVSPADESPGAGLNTAIYRFGTFPREEDTPIGVSIPSPPESKVLETCVTLEKVCRVCKKYCERGHQKVYEPMLGHPSKILRI
jgi:hypothetical protein